MKSHLLEQAGLQPTYDFDGTLALCATADVATEFFARSGVNGLGGPQREAEHADGGWCCSRRPRRVLQLTATEINDVLMSARGAVRRGHRAQRAGGLRALQCACEDVLAAQRLPAKTRRSCARDAELATLQLRTRRARCAKRSGCCSASSNCAAGRSRGCCAARRRCSPLRDRHARWTRAAPRSISSHQFIVWTLAGAEAGRDRQLS